ncbi:MAG: VWA domain-containing protein [Pseudomonadota bacterium]
MKKGFPSKLVPVACLCLLALIAACSDNVSEQATEKQGQNSSGQQGASTATSGPVFTIYAGSEMSGLEPMIMDWARKKGADVRINYKGSIDMMRMMADGTASPADAYWPAHTIWFILGDTQSAVKNKRSIMVSPIVVGLKQSMVRRLGWDKNNPTLEEFLTAAKAGKFRYAKTSSTQSNSGALFHLAAWWSFAGKPENWTMDIVSNPAIRARVKDMESTVAATSGSSGWLTTKILNEFDKLDGMVNYEAMISEADIGWTTIDKKSGREVKHQGLIDMGLEPLQVVYLEDATMMADHPLGYVDKGDGAKAGIFQNLQEFLLSSEAQKQMIRQGRRNRLLAADPSLAHKKAFNPAYGFDINRVIAPIQPPREDVLTAILDLYQEEMRKPSATFWVIDDSGSMYKNGGKAAVRDAMSMLLTPARARQFKLQPTPRDIHAVVPFSKEPGEVLLARGNDPAVLDDLMTRIRRISLGSGTNMYAGVMAALNLIKQNESEIQGHFPAIAVLSDGISDGSLQEVIQTRNRLGLTDVPIYTLSFGSDVDESQLKDLAGACGGRYFSGKEDVADAFRQMKGYN